VRRSARCRCVRGPARLGNALLLNRGRRGLQVCGNTRVAQKVGAKASAPRWEVFETKPEDNYLAAAAEQY
jgi:hypothetical protein